MKVFFIAFFILTAAALFLAIHSLQFADRIEEVPLTFAREDFNVTDFSTGGSVFFSGDLAKAREDFVNERVLRLNEWPAKASTRKVSLRADEQTSFEFVFGGFFFLGLPSSQIVYMPQTRQLFLKKGEFFWKRKSGLGQVNISLQKPENVLTLSAAGRLRIRENALEVWNFEGQAEFNGGNARYQMKELQHVAITENRRALWAAIAPAPESIFPEDEIIELRSPGDSQVQFNWKNVAGVTQYLLRLYPSALKEKVLVSRIVDGNSVGIDLSPYLGLFRIYWDVCAFDQASDLESAPSEVGALRFAGMLVSRKTSENPPELAILSLTVSGNMVVIKGTASSDALITIDGAPVKPDSEGKFIHSIFYTSVGRKEIVFIARGPSGLTTTLKRYVDVYDESLY